MSTARKKPVGGRARTYEVNNAMNDLIKAIRRALRRTEGRPGSVDLRMALKKAEEVREMLGSSSATPKATARVIAAILHVGAVAKKIHSFLNCIFPQNYNHAPWVHHKTGQTIARHHAGAPFGGDWRVQDSSFASRERQEGGKLAPPSHRRETLANSDAFAVHRRVAA